MNLNNIQDKLNLINDNNNETCNYIVSLINNYIERIERANNSIYNKSFYQKEKVMFCDAKNNINFLSDANVSKTIIYFTQEPIDELLSFCNTLNLVNRNFIIVGKYSNDEKQQISVLSKNIVFSNFNISKLKEYINEDCIININLNYYNIDSSWFTNIDNTFSSIFNNLAAYSVEQIIADPAIVFNKPGVSKFVDRRDTYNLSKVIKFILKFKNAFKNINFDVLINYTEEDNLKYKYTTDELSEIFRCLKAVSRKEQISLIYNYICNYLDNDFSKLNYCYFKDNKCIVQRDSLTSYEFPILKENGCCYNTAKKDACEYFNCGSCKIQCTSCKLLVCKYLRDKGIGYDIHGELIVKCFFNILERPIFVWSFFTKKEDIIRKLNLK